MNETTLGITEIWAQYGLVGLCMLGLFVLLIADKLLLKKSIEHLPEQIRRAVMSSLFESGLLKERRKKDIPVEEDHRNHV
jgi:hypothetical protein